MGTKKEPEEIGFLGLSPEWIPIEPTFMGIDWEFEQRKVFAAFQLTPQQLGYKMTKQERLEILLVYYDTRFGCMSDHDVIELTSILRAERKELLAKAEESKRQHQIAVGLNKADHEAYLKLRLELITEAEKLCVQLKVAAHHHQGKHGIGVDFTRAIKNYEHYIFTGKVKSD